MKYDNNLKKVIWVEENPLYTLDIQNEAYEYGLALITYNCWDDACNALKCSFEEWVAIILQPKSKLHPGSYENVKQFLPQAFSDINVICSLKGHNLPWYLLTGIDPSEFKDMILESRDTYDKEWPQGYYYIDDEYQRKQLFTRIKEYTQLSERHQVRTGLYKNIFDALDYLEYHKLSSKVRPILEDLLISLCFGNNKIADFGFIRIIIEYIFLSMVDNGLLPDLRNISGNINISDCSKLLSGKTFNNNDIRFECITPLMCKIMSSNIYNMIMVSTPKHHASIEQTELDIYSNMVDTDNLLHSYVLQICDIIIWYRKILDSGRIPKWWKEHNLNQL